MAWSSRVVLVLFLASSANVILEKAAIADPLGLWGDLVVALAGLLVSLLLTSIAERQRARLRRRYSADLKALAAFRYGADAERCAREASTEEIRHLLDSPADAGGLLMVFQPIVDLTTGLIAGFEALARFPTGGPKEWFDAAAEVGLGPDLELAAIQRALRDMEGYVRTSGMYLSLNCSPTTLLDDRFWELFGQHDASHIVIEVTEHIAVEDYAQYTAVLSLIRRLGARLAIDDAGSGYSSLQHIVRLDPDIVKIDRAFVDVDTDQSKHNAVKALISLANSMHATVVVEGVETEGQRQELRRMGANYVQGYLSGRPQPAGFLVDAVARAG